MWYGSVNVSITSFQFIAHSWRAGLDRRVAGEAVVGQFLLCAVKRVVDAERCGVGVGPHEHEPVVLGHGQLVEPVGGLVDVVEAGLGAREGPQAAVEPVRPRVVRARDPAEPRAGRCHQQCGPAVPTGVHERLQATVGLTDDDDGDPARRRGEEGSRRRRPRTTGRPAAASRRTGRASRPRTPPAPCTRAPGCACSPPPAAQGGGRRPPGGDAGAPPGVRGARMESTQV